MPQSTMTHRDREIVPARLAIRAMRDSAIGTLRMRSPSSLTIPSKRKLRACVVFGVEEEVKVQTRWRRRLVQIGVHG